MSNDNRNRNSSYNSDENWNQQEGRYDQQHNQYGQQGQYGNVNHDQNNDRDRNRRYSGSNYGSYGYSGSGQQNTGNYGAGYNNDHNQYNQGSSYGNNRNQGSNQSQWGQQSNYGESGAYGRRDRDDYSSNYGNDRNYGGGYGSSANYGSTHGNYNESNYGNSGSGGSNYGSSGNRGNWGNNNRNQDRDWWERTKDEVSSWFGDEDAERRRRMDRVVSHRGKGPRDYRRSDERILEDVCDRLSDDSFIDASDIDVKVSGSDVVLTGTVESREAKRRAEDLAESISGVANVQNNLKVKGSDSGGLRSSSESGRYKE